MERCSFTFYLSLIKQSTPRNYCTKLHYGIIDYALDRVSFMQGFCKSDLHDLFFMICKHTGTSKINVLPDLGIALFFYDRIYCNLSYLRFLSRRWFDIVLRYRLVSIVTKWLSWLDWYEVKPMHTYNDLSHVNLYRIDLLAPSHWPFRLFGNWGF